VTKLIAVVGMVSEARVVAGEDVTVVIGGGRSIAVAERLEQALGQGAAGVISFGLCGALDPALEVGDILVASSDPDWARRLIEGVPGARMADITGSDQVIPDADAKAELRRRTGAAAVDMESHIVARLARRHGVPFAALRAVSDTADRVLPKAARAGLRADGEPDIFAVLKSLIADPRQLPALIRTAFEADAALRALVGARHLLGPGIGRLDLGQHLVDVA